MSGNGTIGSDSDGWLGVYWHLISEWRFRADEKATSCSVPDETFKAGFEWGRWMRRLQAMTCGR